MGSFNGKIKILIMCFQQLQQTYAQLEEERSQAHMRHEEAKRVLVEAHALREHVMTQEREERKRHRQQWQREFSKAQRQVNEIVEVLKKEKSPSRLQATRQAMASIDQQMKQHVPLAEVHTFSIPQVGDLVEN